MEPIEIFLAGGAIAALGRFVAALVAPSTESTHHNSASTTVTTPESQDDTNKTSYLPQLTNPCMEYLCYLANASLTLRLIEYLHNQPQLKVSFVTVIHQINGWVVRIKLENQISPKEDGDFRAFLSELGMSYLPPKHLEMALMSLAVGQPLTDVMRRYQVAVVCHGYPEKHHIEAFRQHFIKGLGYCPPTLI